MLIRTLSMFVVAAALMIGSGSTASAATVTVDVGDLWFCDSSYNNNDDVCTTTINVGDTVMWNFNVTPTPHDTTDCGGDCDAGPFGQVWDSGNLSSGSYSHQFNQAGTFPYYCALHPFAMRAEVVVNGPVGGIAELPASSGGASAANGPAGRDPFVPAGIAAAVAAGVFALGGAALYARRRGSR